MDIDYNLEFTYEECKNIFREYYIETYNPQFEFDINIIYKPNVIKYYDGDSYTTSEAELVISYFREVCYSGIKKLVKEEIKIYDDELKKIIGKYCRNNNIPTINFGFDENGLKIESHISKQILIKSK